MNKHRKLTKKQLRALRAHETRSEGRRAPITLAGAQSRPVLSADRRRHVVSVVVDALRDWRDNRWEGEASARFGLRVGLILQGYDWAQSDNEAAEVVRCAFVELGRGSETRPRKEEGQQYHTYAREHCRWCFGPIAAEDMTGGRQRTFCSDHCARRAYLEWDMRNASKGGAIEREAYRAVYRDRTPSKECEQCGATFKLQTASRDARFCSLRCFTESLRVTIEERDCQHCGTRFTPASSNVNAKFCGKPCADAAQRIYQPRSCKICPATFIPKSDHQIFCSPACAHKGKALREVECFCHCCGVVFLGKRADAEYCSNTCERFAYRVRTGRIRKISGPCIDYLFRRQGLRITGERMAA